MSDYDRLGYRLTSGGALLCDVKPSHVRCLNFGQSILELNAVEQCCAPNGILVVDENVAHIPCTEKEDYVRKWLETHENGGHDTLQLSPVLGTSISQRSPVLYSGRKRFRKKICRNRNVTAKSTDHHESAGQSANCRMQFNNKPHCEYKENSKEWKPMDETQNTPPGLGKVVPDETSPVLYRVFKKKRRKKPQYEAKDSISPESSKLHNRKVTSTSIKLTTGPDASHSRNNLREMPWNQDKLKKNLGTKTGTFVFSTEARESPEKYQRCIETFSPSTQEKLSFTDSSSSSTEKNDSKIETSTSDSKDEEYDEECDEVTSTPSGNNNLSNFIEDTNTQETTKTSQYAIVNKYLNVPSGQPFDLDETYCSERMLDQCLSTKVSEIQSLNKTTQKTGSKSTQTAVISTITTPSRKSPDRSMYAHLLDSGKKRCKPKTGSMAARLHSLINAQISSIRIWRYRMNKEHSTTSAQYISVLVHDSIKQFGNQFLEGVLIEDRFNLLQSDVQTEQTEAHNQVQPKGALYKNLTIMIVCDIVGTLKMISKVVINVYPPWNILDKDDLTLEAMYISIDANHEIPDIENTGKSRERKNRVIKEFTCPCIEEQRELPFCARNPSSDKPDVMQQIFNF